MQAYGLNSLQLVKLLLFQDSEWGNIVNLTGELVRAIVLKSDRTIIDLGSQGAGSRSEKVSVHKLLEK